MAHPLVEAESKAFHREVARVGRARFMAALQQIDPAALKVADLTDEQRVQLRDLLATVPSLP